MILGFSTKQHGQMRVIDGKLTPDVLANRQAFLNEFGFGTANTVSAGLVHGNHVEAVTGKDRGTVFASTDAFITQDPEVVLTITTADCLPLYFFDEKQKAVGVAHAGWKGVLKEVAVATLKAMQENFGSKPEKVKVYIGPHLKKCHFEVRQDVAKLFQNYLHINELQPTNIILSPPQHHRNTTQLKQRESSSSFLPAKQQDPPSPLLPLKQGELEGVDLPVHINLSAVVEIQLQKAGVLIENIKISPECTFCLTDKYFSFRRDKPEIVEAQLAFISLAS